MARKNVKDYSYKIILGDEQASYSKNYHYKYYSSDVTLEISKNYGRISFNRHNKEKTEKFVKGYFFNESIKRLLFVHLLNFDSLLENKTCKISIDGTEYTDIPVQIVSIFSGKNFEKIPSSLKSDELIKDLIQNFTQNNIKMIVLNNYLLALSYKDSPVEQFMHLWMAFNGLYGYFKTKVQEHFHRTGYVSENKELKWWGIGFNLELPDNLFSNERDLHVRYAKEIIESICELSDFETVNSLESLRTSSVNQRIIDEINLKYGSTINNSFSYVLLKIAYFKRCDLFHGAKKIILFTSKPQRRYKLFRFLNSLLIEYIAHEFNNVFDVTLLNETITRNQNKLR